MDEQTRKHRAEMERQAVPVIERYVQQHPQYTIDADQAGSQSVTNYVIFGRHIAQSGDRQRGDGQHVDRQPSDEQRVIFKYFCRDERKQRELFGLRHFAATGIVPQLLEDVGPRLIVVSHIEGNFLHGPEVDEAAFQAIDRQTMGYTLGQATAKLVNTPLSTEAAADFESRFYNGETLPAYFQNILQASKEIHRRVACYQDEIFAHSLATIEASLPTLLAQPRLLYHQDALNMHFVGSRFSGFFDLEMCRVGTEAMQIGSLWRIFTTFGCWDAFAQGFSAGTGRALSQQSIAASRAFAHFMLWRSISDYGDWHGEPLAEAEMAEMVAQAGHYRQSLALI